METHKSDKIVFWFGYFLGDIRLNEYTENVRSLFVEAFKRMRVVFVSFKPTFRRLYIVRFT